MRICDFNIDTDRFDLTAPHCIVMLRPWINVGNVGHIVLKRLSRVYGARKIGQLEKPSKFYDYTRYRPQIQIVNGERRFRLPNTDLLAASTPKGHDLLLLRLLEPHSWAEDFNDSVIETMRSLDVERYILVGSMYDSVPHSRPLKITGSAKGWKPPDNFIQKVRLGSSSYQGPTSIVSQLTERVRTEMQIQTLSMIVHLPMYLKVDEDYAGAARLLSILAELYQSPTDEMPEIAIGETQYRQIDTALADNHRLKELVARFEKEYDSEDERAATPSNIELTPEIERFLENVARHIDDDIEDESRSSGGM